jgi:hypothetical protein
MDSRHCRRSCLPVVPLHSSGRNGIGPPTNCTRRSKLAMRPLSRSARARLCAPAIFASGLASCESTLTASDSEYLAGVSFLLSWWRSCLASCGSASEMATLLPHRAPSSSCRDVGSPLALLPVGRNERPEQGRLLFGPHFRVTTLASTGLDRDTRPNRARSRLWPYATVGALACLLFRYTSAGTTASDLP